VLAGTDVYLPPFGATMREWVAADTHETRYFILLALIAFHIAAAVFAELKEGGAVISAMFTGRKLSAREPVDTEHVGAAAADRDRTRRRTERELRRRRRPSSACDSSTATAPPCNVGFHVGDVLEIKSPVRGRAR
jgi:hypothetical protein